MQAHDFVVTSARPDGEQPSWRIIWNYLVPPKVMSCKICRNALANKTNLFGAAWLPRQHEKCDDGNTRIYFMFLYVARMLEVSEKQ